jgi:hypothetical protein
MKSAFRRACTSFVHRSACVGANIVVVGATALAGNGNEFWGAPNFQPSTLYRLDENGAVSAVGNIPNIEPADFALASDGTLYAVTMDELYVIDTTTAGATLVGPVQTFAGLVGLDFAPNGQLWAVNYTGGVMKLDTATAGSIQVFSLPVNFSGDIALASNTIAYAAIDGANGSDLARVDLQFASYTNLGTIAPGNGIWGLDFDGSGNLIAITVSGDLYSIPNYTTSGTGVFLASTNQGGLGGLASADGGCPSIGAYCTAGVTTSGCTAMMTASGTPSASATSGFTLSMFNAEPQKQGILFYGINNSGFTPLPWGASSSFICVKSPTQRMTVQNTGGSLGQCNGTMSTDWNAFRASTPGALGTPFASGQNVYAQGWFRDPPSPKTTNLSNAVRFTVCP